MRLITVLRTILLMYLAAMGSLAARSQTVPSNFSLQVNGMVRYSGSRAPAERVLVRIESFGGGLVSQATTDRTGKFSFMGLSPRQYIVTVHAPGYIDVRENVNLVTNNSGYLNVELVPEKSSILRNVNDPHNLRGPSVIDATVPVQAQDEYTKGRQHLGGTKKSGTETAVRHLERAVSIYPKFLEAQLLLGLAYMDLQQWEKAEKPLLESIGINAKATTAYVALAETYRRQKKYAEAEKTLSDAFKLGSETAEGHLVLAKIFWERAPMASDEKQFRAYSENAWVEVNKALQLNPNHAEAHLLAGNILLRARRAEEALIRFEQYLKLEPKGEFAEETNSVVKKIRDSLEHSKSNK